MSIVGFFIILSTILYFIYCLINKQIIDFRWYLFLGMILSNMFIGIGYVINIGITLPYYMFFQILFCIFSIILIYISKINIKMRNKNIYSALIFFSLILVGIFNLLVSNDLPQIILEYDSFILGDYYGTYIPYFNEENRYYLINLVLFLVTIFLSQDYLINKEKVISLIKYMKKFYMIYFIILLFEILISNIFNNTYFRDIILFSFGVQDYGKGISDYIFRNGIIGGAVFFPETSYISIVLIYYLLNLKQGLNSNLEILMHYISMVLLLLSGSSAGAMLLPLAIIISLKEIINKRKKYIHGLFLLCYICIIINLIYIYSDIFYMFKDILISKINSYLSGEESNDIISYSGLARNFGNEQAYKIFIEEPFWGIGLGSIWAFGIIPSALANMGIIPLLAYSIYIKYNFYISIYKRNILLLIILVLYCTSIYQFNYLFTPFAFALFILFNVNLRRC